MLTNKQKEKIYNLISQKQEGAYWDFKREWYSKERQADLLHDIICMANNMECRDAYIIIGIDEEKDCSIQDVKNDPNRRNTQKIVDFLRDKKFAGGVRPRVVVEPLQVEDGEIDIIIIKNDYYTPYFLEENYKGVNANNIYTRVFDTNTPKNKSADIVHIEYLWKKRFRLLSTPLEQIFYYLLSREDWLDTEDNSSMTRKYYKYAPEFVIEYCKDNNRNGYEYYLFSQRDSRPHWYNIYVNYYRTTLFSTIGIGLDGNRGFTNVPCTDFLFDKWRDNGKILFKYYIKESREWILHEFFMEYESDEAMYVNDRFEECVLIFKSEWEMQEFKYYAREKWEERTDYLKGMIVPYMELPEGYVEDAFKEEYENALILKKMLDEYRTI